MSQSDPSAVYDVFLQLDLTESGNKALAAYGARILRLLQSPQAEQNHYFVATLDDFLGVLYALILAKCNSRPFRGRRGPIEARTIVKRAEHVSEGRVRVSGNWLAGFYFNSALFRIAATYHRGLKVASGKETDHKITLWELLKIIHRAFPGWNHEKLDDIHNEVNDLKHSAEGLFRARRVDWEQAGTAVEQLLELFELWITEKEIVTTIRTANRLR